MQKVSKFFNKLVSSILVLLFVVSPYFLIPKKVQAQTGGSYQSSGSYSFGGATGISAYLSGMAPAIAQLPLCKGKLQNMVQGLFRKGGGADAYSENLSEFGVDDTVYNVDDWETFQSEAEAKASSVLTYDPETNKKLDEQKEKLEKIEKTNASIEQNDTCLKSIGRMVIKMVLQKMTVSTVAWIQSGFHGSPAFIQNPETFFRDIARNEILEFGLEIQDPDLYPFGKDFMRRQAQIFNKKFADNAQYSLNQLIQQTTPEFSAVTFQGDFSAGGWDAWTYLTAVPANNPLGFQLMASNELRLRLEGTWQSDANELRDALQEAGGYLGDYRCANPKGLSKEDHEKALEAGDKAGMCQNWQYVTPGLAVAEAATTAINYPNNNLLEADDLNTAMAAIIDALIMRFSSDLMNRGLADFSNEGIDGSYIINPDNIVTGAASQTEEDFSSFQLGSSFLKERPNFNIRTDITQALIDEQRIYVEKLKEQNEILTLLNTTIYQADYCNPAPHYNWKYDSREILTAVEDSWVSKTPIDMEQFDKADLTGLIKAAGYVAGAVIGSVIGQTLIPIPGIGAAIGAAIGALIGWIADLLGGPSNEEKLDRYYGNIIGVFSGIHVNATYFEKDERALLTNKHDVTNIFDAIFYRYSTMIDKYYVPEFLPTVAKDIDKEFRKSVGYKQTILDNEDEIILMNGVIRRLGNIKDQIDTLNGQYTPGSDEYEDALDPVKGEFSRLSYNLVTGNDIATKDNLTKEAKEEIRYVYEDLLVGPFGCEQDLQFNRQPVLPAKPDKTWILKQTKRMPYPARVWYDYNTYNPNEQFPVPTELAPYISDDIVGNRMPDYPITSFGPGFLSAVWFDYSADLDNNNQDSSCKGRLNNLHPFELDCLIVSNLFRHVNSWPVSVGMNAKDFDTNGVGIYKGSGGGQSSLSFPWKFEQDSNGPTNQQQKNSFEVTIGIY